MDRQVLTVSEISQMEQVRFFPHPAGQNDDAYRKAILDDLIGQALHRLLAHAASEWVFASLYSQPLEAAAIRVLIRKRAVTIL